MEDLTTIEAEVLRQVRDGDELSFSLSPHQIGDALRRLQKLECVLLEWWGEGAIIIKGITDKGRAWLDAHRVAADDEQIPWTGQSACGLGKVKEDRKGKS